MLAIGWSTGTANTVSIEDRFGQKWRIYSGTAFEPEHVNVTLIDHRIGLIENEIAGSPTFKDIEFVPYMCMTASYCASSSEWRESVTPSFTTNSYPTGLPSGNIQHATLKHYADLYAKFHVTFRLGGLATGVGQLCGIATTSDMLIDMSLQDDGTRYLSIFRSATRKVNQPSPSEGAHIEIYDAGIIDTAQFVIKSNDTGYIVYNTNSKLKFLKYDFSNTLSGTNRYETIKEWDTNATYSAVVYDIIDILWVVRVENGSNDYIVFATVWQAATSDAHSILRIFEYDVSEKRFIFETFTPLSDEPLHKLKETYYNPAPVVSGLYVYFTVGCDPCDPFDATPLCVCPTYQIYTLPSLATIRLINDYKYDQTAYGHQVMPASGGTDSLPYPYYFVLNETSTGKYKLMHVNTSIPPMLTLDAAWEKTYTDLSNPRIVYGNDTVIILSAPMSTASGKMYDVDGALLGTFSHFLPDIDPITVDWGRHVVFDDFNNRLWVLTDSTLTGKDTSGGARADVTCAVHWPGGTYPDNPAEVQILNPQFMFLVSGAIVIAVTHRDIDTGYIHYKIYTLVPNDTDHV